MYYDMPTLGGELYSIDEDYDSKLNSELKIKY
jgi:hypothetical protein